MDVWRQCTREFEKGFARNPVETAHPSIQSVDNLSYSSATIVSLIQYRILMLAIATRSRLPQLACQCRNLHVRDTSESATRPPQDTLHHNAAQLPSNTAAAALSEQQAALDPAVQEQIKRMLRVDHAGEFAAGNRII